MWKMLWPPFYPYGLQFTPTNGCIKSFEIMTDRSNQTFLWSTWGPIHASKCLIVFVHGYIMMCSTFLLLFLLTYFGRIAKLIQNLLPSSNPNRSSPPLQVQNPQCIHMPIRHVIMHLIFGPKCRNIFIYSYLYYINCFIICAKLRCTFCYPSYILSNGVSFFFDPHLSMRVWLWSPIFIN